MTSDFFSPIHVIFSSLTDIIQTSAFCYNLHMSFSLSKWHLFNVEMTSSPIHVFFSIAFQNNLSVHIFFNKQISLFSLRTTCVQQRNVTQCFFILLSCFSWLRPFTKLTFDSCLNLIGHGSRATFNSCTHEHFCSSVTPPYHCFTAL